MKLQREFTDLSSMFDGAIFSSFVFNSDYFERTLLKILSGKSLAEEIIICVDSGSYRETIENDEVRLNSVGKEYYLCPIRMTNGRFHPKVYFFASEDRAAAFVGSANLTAHAFDQNQEIVTKFELKNTDDNDLDGPELAALADIHEFYSQLLEHPVAEAIGKTSKQKMEELLETTMWVTETGSRDSTGQITAVLHNLEVPLLDQIKSRLVDRGEEINQADIIAPFYGNSVSIPESLTNEGIDTRVWLQQDRTQVDITKLELWEQKNENAETIVFDLDRYVHGKVLLIETDAATYCLTGSPNASQAAMLESVDANDEYANIEVGVFRRSEEPDHFGYLRNKIAAHRVEDGIESFRSNSSPEYRPSEPDTTDTVNLLSVDFTRSELFEGGRLYGQVLLPAPVNEADELTLTIKSLRDTEPISIQFSGTELSKDEDTDRHLYTFDRRVNDDDQLTYLSSPAQVCPTWNSTDGRNRWLSIESRDVDREVKSAATNDGVDSVWRTVQDIFLGDGKKYEEIDILGSILTVVDNGQPTDGGETGNGAVQGNGDGDDEDGKLTKSINLPVYNQSASSTDPVKQFEGFFERWKEQVRILRNQLLDDDASNQKILMLTGERLAAFNRTLTWLAVVRRELNYRNESVDRSLTVLPKKYMRILYSQSEAGRPGNSSVTAQFIRDARNHLRSESEIELLWDEVGVNIIFGQLIADRLLMDDSNTYEESVGSDFDRLIDQCLSEYEAVVGETVATKETSDMLWDHYAELPTTLERASLSRYAAPPREFRDKSITQRYVGERIND